MSAMRTCMWSLTAAVLAAVPMGCSVPSAKQAQGAVEADLESRFGKPTPLNESGAEAIREMLADKVLDADEAVRVAIANNKRLRSILEELNIARAEIWRASLPPNPVVGGEVQFIESGGGDLLELSVAQNIIDILLIPRRRQVASERFEQVKAEVTAAVVDLATEVRASYRRLQAQSELVGLFVAANEATFLTYDAARRLREAGNIIEVEMLTEQALYEETKIVLTQARVVEQQERENLNALLGIWERSGENWDIARRLPTPEPLTVSPDALEKQALEASLDLEAMHHKITALGHEVGLRRLEVTFPTGTLGGIAEREADGTWSGGPFASLSVPVFNWGQAVGAEAQAHLRKAYEEYTDLAIRLRRTARSTFLATSTAAANSRYLRERLLPLRGQITEQFQRQFNAMQLGVFQLLQVRRQELAAGRRYVETLRDHWLARVQLEAILLGRLPMGGYGISSPAAGSNIALGGGGGGGH